MNKFSIKTVVLVGYLALIHGLLAIALARTELLHLVGQKLHVVKPQIPEEESIIPRLREAYKNMDASIPAGVTIFLGDSITMSLATPAVAQNSINFGIGWQRSDQLLKSMEAYSSIDRASRVVVTIGTNDLLQGREEGIESRYQMLLKRIPADVDIVMSSVPPIGNISFYGVHKVMDSSVRAVVESARRVCKNDNRCRFVDAYAALTKDGEPIEGVLLQDEIHLTPKGYALWIDALKKEIEA